MNPLVTYMGDRSSTCFQLSKWLTMVLGLEHALLREYCTSSEESLSSTNITEMTALQSSLALEFLLRRGTRHCIFSHTRHLTASEPVSSVPLQLQVLRC